jgi:hypothetical protein
VGATCAPGAWLTDAIGATHAAVAGSDMSIRTRYVAVYAPMPTIALSAKAATSFAHRSALDIRSVVGSAPLAPR